MKKERDTSLQHPQEIYYTEEFIMQKQEGTGSHHQMEPHPDSGEDNYVGSGRLKGRKALITGGDSGIGRAIVIAFAREGADVAINYLPEEEEDARSLAALLEEEGIKIYQLPGDLRDERICIGVVEQAYKDMQGLDILVLNAGVQTAQEDIADLTAEQVHQTFEVNVFAPMLMAKTAIPLMQPGSSIIFTGSAEYYTPNKLLLDYAASKYAIVGFSKALAKQTIDKGIRVNTVCPGPVWSPLEVVGGNPDEGIPKHGLDTPLKRAGQPVEISGIYVHLASNEATYTTGEVYGVTGGLSM